MQREDSQNDGGRKTRPPPQELSILLVRGGPPVLATLPLFHLGDKPALAAI